MRNIFSPSPSELPDIVPAFPMDDVLLLPGGRLPLNIYEPHYIEMIRTQLSERLRLIGIIQPAGETGDGFEPPLHSVGCAGKIVSFTEQEDRYLIVLEGLCRFTVDSEIDPIKGYRRIRPNWSKFFNDLYPDNQEFPKIDRPLLVSRLRTYLDRKGMAANWDAIGTAEDPLLITSLAMMCPFSPEEKQALLEANGAPKLTEMLYSLLELSIHDNKQSTSKH